MTINELIKALQALTAKDEYAGEASVTFGEQMLAVEGGILACNHRTGLVVLNLAELKLDQVGGF